MEAVRSTFLATAQKWRHLNTSHWAIRTSSRAQECTAGDPWIGMVVSCGGAVNKPETTIDGDGKGTIEDPRRAHRYRWWFVVTILFWLGASSVQLFTAKSEAEQGEAALRSLSGASDPTELDLDEIAVTLREGSAELQSARRRLDSPILYPLRPLPVVGRQLSSVRSLVAAATEIVDELQPLVATVQQARAEPDEVDRVQLLLDMSTDLSQLEVVLRNTDLGPEDNLVVQLGDARSDFDEQRLELLSQTTDYVALTAGLASFLEGGNYMLLGANNAEMRLGSGMPTSVGRLRTFEGRFSMEDFQQSSESYPVYGGTVSDQDMIDRWGFVELGGDFRSLTYSGRFDEFVGPQALELWNAEMREDLDGVVLMDPFVIEALLSVTGEVSFEGNVVGPDDVLKFLLQDQYESVGKVKPQDTLARHGRLAQLAVATAAAFEDGGWDPLELVRALGPVARGRHLMLYSVDPVQQRAWEAMGVAGTIDGDEVGVFWLNTGASKLDPLLDVSVQFDHEVAADLRHVTMTIVTTNNGSGDLPEYVVGPWRSLEIPEPGAYSGRLAAYLPWGVQDVVFDPDFGLDVLGPDGNVIVTATSPVLILPGETLTTVLSFTLPSSRPVVRLLPSGRYPAETWTFEGESFSDSVGRDLVFGGE